MIISLMTATGHHNLGDELILLEEYRILKDKYPEAKFNIFTYDEKSSLLPETKEISYVTYFPSGIRKNPFKNISYLFRNIKGIMSSDVVFIGGGGLIYSTEIQKSSNPLWQWKMRVALAKIFNKKIVWLAVGISYPEDKGKDLLPIFKGKNVFVSVRDKSSQNILKKIGVNATLIHDSVFGTEALPEKKTKTKRIGISLRGGYLKGEQENIKQFSLYLSRKGYELVFLSHSIHQEDSLADDYLLMKPFANKYGIRITRTISETYEAYKDLDLVIGMRFHSMILSIVNKIPFIALSYGIKTRELLNEFGLEDYSIDPKTFDFPSFIKVFERLEEHEKELRFDLKAKYDTICSRIPLEFNEFLDGLESIER